MDAFELTEKLVDHLVWPLIVGVSVWCLRKPVVALIPRIKKARVGSLEAEISELIEHRVVDTADVTSSVAEVVSSLEGETAGYRFYSNGLLVQRKKVSLPAGTTSVKVGYVVAIVNEVVSVQVFADLDVRVLEVRNEGLTLSYPVSSQARVVELKITCI